MGRQYLRISIEGQNGYLKAFLNYKKQLPNEPDFTGKGVAIWINQSAAKTNGNKPLPVEQTVPVEL